MVKHLHHIIPKHMGGLDDLSKKSRGINYGV